MSEGGWIQWFCQIDGNEFFVEMDEEFILNRWNLFGINKIVKNYR
jgi:casein kinase II subunit beta